MCLAPCGRGQDGIGHIVLLGEGEPSNGCTSWAPLIRPRFARAPSPTRREGKNRGAERVRINFRPPHVRHLTLALHPVAPGTASGAGAGHSPPARRGQPGKPEGV